MASEPPPPATAPDRKRPPVLTDIEGVSSPDSASADPDRLWSPLLSAPPSGWGSDPLSVTPTVHPAKQNTVEPSLNKDQVWQDLQRIYADNQDTIEKAMALDAAEAAKEGKVAQLGKAMDRFSETAKVISEALIALGNVHPVIGVAVFAFHSVISLDATRRENNRKVLAVKLQMQNMMCALFQLRHLKFVHFGDEEESTKESFAAFMKVIADDITQCGSDLNYYREKKFIAKLLNSKVYEMCFAEHIENFALRRSQLQTFIAGYTAQGISVTNEKLTAASTQLKKMDEKLEIIVESLFRKLDTPQEDAAFKFVSTNGGREQCVNKDSLLRRLLVISGQPINVDRNAAAGKSGGSGGGGDGLGNMEATAEPTSRENSIDQLRTVRDQLKQELTMDVRAALKENMARFEAKLKVQSNNLERISDQLQGQGIILTASKSRLDQLMSTSLLILREGKLIKKAVLPSGTIHLKDSVLQAIWQRMGLKANVKAKHFVLSLRDHLLSEISSNPPTVQQTPAIPTFDLPPETNEPKGPPAEPNFHPHQSNVLSVPPEDVWVLQYLDPLHVQPILEAMDEDGSGFISVTEANRFAIARPPGCSLFRWLAFWAAGWHLSLLTYKSKIYRLLQAMHARLKNQPSFIYSEAFDLHSFASRAYIERYLDEDVIGKIDMMLRSTRSAEDVRREQKLIDLAETITKQKEERINANLKDLGYVISSPQDARLVIGMDRIEVSIYPLIYLLLKHHLKIMELSAHTILTDDELSTASSSLDNVFVLFSERLTTLSATFSQMHQDVRRQFEVFAYGMFLDLYLEYKVDGPDRTRTSILEFSNFNEILDLDDHGDDDLAANNTDRKGHDSTILKGGEAKRPVVDEICHSLVEAMKCLHIGFLDDDDEEEDDDDDDDDDDDGEWETEGESDDEGLDRKSEKGDDTEVKGGESEDKVPDEEQKPEGTQAKVDNIAEEALEQGDTTKEQPDEPERVDEPSQQDSKDDEITTATPVPLPAFVEAVCGYWSGSSLMTNHKNPCASAYRAWHCVLRADGDDGSIVGEGEAFFGTFQVKGGIKDGDDWEDASTVEGSVASADVIDESKPGQDAAEDGDESPDKHTFPMELDFRPVVDGYLGLRCSGVYDRNRELIDGTWSFFDPDDDEDDQSSDQDSSDGNDDDDEENSNQDGSDAEGGDEDDASLVQTEDRSTSADDEPEGDEDDEEEEEEDDDDSGDGYSTGSGSSLNDEQGTFLLTRTPAMFCRFRRLLDLPGPIEVAAASDTGALEDAEDDTQPNPSTSRPRTPCDDPPLPSGSILRTGFSPPPPPFPSLARRRWNFACEAVLYHVKAKLFSRSFFRDRLKERRRWLEISMEALWSEKLPGGDRETQVDDNMYQELFQLRFDVPPSNSRLYEATAVWYVDRDIRNIGYVSCDVCRRNIVTVVRHHCITCIGDGFINQVDLCIHCLNNSIVIPEQAHVNHLPTHSMIRSRKDIPQYEIKHVLLDAKEKATRLKEKFRSLEGKREETVYGHAPPAPSGKGGGSGAKKSKTNTEPLYCACCRREVRPPCWLCLECEHDTVICMDCDSNRAPIHLYHPSHYQHTWLHRLLWIRTSQAVSARRPTPQTEVAKLDKRLEDVETRLQQEFETRMSSIERQFEDRLQRIEVKMENQIGRVEERMDRMLGLLQQLLLTAGTSSMH